MSLLLLLGGSFQGIANNLGVPLSLGYSFRRLTSSYSAFCCNIRRSSDNTEANITFVGNGDFNQTQYRSLCGANLLLNTATLATQSVATSPANYVLSFSGTGTVTLSGTSTAGPLVGIGVGDRTSLAFTATEGTLTLTVSGTVTEAQLEFGSTATTYEARTGTAASKGFLTTWYDQSTSTLNATQSTQANQPQLLPRQYGEKPELYFKEASQHHLLLASVLNPTAYCLSTVGYALGTPPYPCASCLGNPHQYFRLGADIWGTYLNGNVTVAGGIVTKSSTALNVRNYNDVDLVTNGSTSLNTSGLGFYSRASAFIATDGSNYLDGKLNEILLTSALSSTQIATLYNSQKTYWGTP